MCLAVPAQVISIDDNTAQVDIMGVSMDVSIGLLQNVVIGDYLLIHAGCAIQKMSSREASSTLELIKTLVTSSKHSKESS